MSAEKYLNEVKSLTDKIDRKKQEIVLLEEKKEKCSAKLMTSLMSDNNMSLDDVVGLFQSTAPQETKVKEDKNG